MGGGKDRVKFERGKTRKARYINEGEKRVGKGVIQKPTYSTVEIGRT